jgi:hypothetical protein
VGFEPTYASNYNNNNYLKNGQAMTADQSACALWLWLSRKHIEKNRGVTGFIFIDFIQ